MIQKQQKTAPAGISQITGLQVDGLLGERLRNNETRWLHHVLDRNPLLFDVYRHRDTNPRCIVPWFGEYPGKLLTGMAFTYRMSGDPDTLAAGNEMVEQLASVQGENGYLGPHPHDREYIGCMHEDTPKVFGWGLAPLWDVWGQYHEIFGLVQWYAATGSRKALDIACRTADGICAFFVKEHRPFSLAKEADKNLTVGHALLLLYRETGEEGYKQAAEMVVEEWSKPGCGNWLNDALAGKEFYQSELHRWEALHCVMTLAELYRVTNDI